jgi:hypothetical protein
MTENCGAAVINRMEPEAFVDAAAAAAFLCVSRKHILKLSRLGRIPAHPLGFGTRKTWRFLLSELRDHVLGIGAVTEPMPNANQDRINAGSPRKGGH